MRPGMKPRPWNTKDRKALLKALRGWEEIKPSQFATLHGLSASRVRKLCVDGRIDGAYRDVTGNFIIPRHAKILKGGDTKCRRLNLSEGDTFRPGPHRNIMAYAEATIIP